MLLTVKNISKSFSGFEIKDVSFDVHQGQYFVLLGASGVGKSVLLEIIAGLTRPDAGQIFLNGKEITNEKIQKRKIGLVFQNSTLFPHMTVYDNIAYPLRNGHTKSQISKRVAQLAEDFGVTDLLNRKSQMLSGGETQRVCLARTVASEPDCLLLDEPICSLDATSRPQIRALLRRINANGQTIIHVTHDYTEAVSLGTHIAVMERGIISHTGKVEDIFQHPKSEFIARFIGIRNFFKGHLEQSQHQSGLKHFRTGSVDFSVLTDRGAGNGFVCVRSEDVTISKTTSSTSARNNFKGAIVDVVPASVGVEVIVDIGVEIAALVTAESVKSLELGYGKKVWVSFKASAVKYAEE
ncbi:MAG: ABC transporter ATP-binding protein [Planctomycetota bacterium]|jgi:molybdopterin-binding protein